MNVITHIRDMQQWSETLRQSGKTISVVPTMGFFHDGHLSLMKKGMEVCDHLVVTLFVNPTQFGPTEDLSSYPANVERDIDLARKQGASAIFIPNKEEMYPETFQTYVELTDLPHHLCGISRPVHFRGVATVVTKLFNIIRPHTAIFGSKDFQQLQIIRRMTEDLNYDIKIIGCPIVREIDGLAMSSRNAYLKPEQRTSALSLSKALNLAEEKIAQATVPDAATLKREMKQFIESHDETQIDYISVCNPETLEEVNGLESTVLIALAVKVGKTRLIDNCVIAQEQ